MNKTQPLTQGMITVRETNGYSLNCSKCGETCVLNDRVNVSIIGRFMSSRKIYHEKCFDSLYMEDNKS